MLSDHLEIMSGVCIRFSKTLVVITFLLNAPLLVFNSIQAFCRHDSKY